MTSQEYLATALLRYGDISSYNLTTVLGLAGFFGVSKGKIYAHIKAKRLLAVKNHFSNNPRKYFISYDALYQFLYPSNVLVNSNPFDRIHIMSTKNATTYWH
jgi:hypothetical protein